MTREEFERIANDELDGVATPADREALRTYLSGHPDAQHRFRDLNDLFARLKEVGLVDPPADLRPSVWRAIEAQQRAAATARRSGGWREIVGGLFRAPAWRGALTFASGVGVGAAAIAIVAGHLVGGARIDSSDLSGAMMPRSAGHDGDIVDARTLEANGLTVSADTRRTSDGVVLRIAASGGGADGAELVATFDGGALHPEALRWDPPSASDVAVGPNRIRIGLQGEGTVTVTLRSEDAHPAPLKLELRSGAQSSRTALKADSAESE
jgi:hypothetical protein